MLASYSEYMHKKAALEQYRAQYPDDADSIAKVQAALADYEQKNDIAADDPGTAREVSALSAPTEGLPSQEEISQQLSHDAPAPAADPRVDRLLGMLDPMQPLVPQALATLPATTHPAGDEAAKDEWVQGDLDNPNGKVIVYDAPLSKVREDLANNPALLDYIGLHMSPGATVEKGDSVEQAYQAHHWRMAANSAAEAGKTAYRYSAAPWLGDGKNASLLDSLKTKLGSVPGDALEAFVLGYDDLANFGAGRAARESGAFAPSKEPGMFQTEESKKRWDASTQAARDAQLRQTKSVGGIPARGEGSERERDTMLDEEHPIAHALGQVAGIAPGLVEGAAKGLYRGAKALVGAGVEAAEQGTKSLAEWSLSNGLWDAITGGAKAAERGVVNSTLRGGGAAATDQAVREGIQAGSRYAETGDTGTTLKDVGEHAAMAAGGGAVLHALGTGLRKGASGFAENVRTGPRYEGAPGRLESHGVEVRVGRGHVDPQIVKDAALRGRKEGGRDALTVLASDLDEPLGDVARGRVAKAEQAEASTVATHRGTPEAGYTLPARNLAETSVEKLRELTSPVPKKGLPGVAKPGSESEVKGIFNKNIEGVSTRKTAHGIPLTADEARSFLSPEWQETGKLDFEKLGKKKGPAVWVTPRRHDSAHFDTVIEELGASKDKQVKSLQEAARKDRAARGTGDYGAARDQHDKDIGKAKKGVKRIGADKDDGVRDTVVRVGKSKGNDKATSALRSAAREAGGPAREQLRGALVAEDLDDLRKKAALGGTARNPLASPWNLWGLGDKAVLRTAYPIARNIERSAPGKAAAATRMIAAATRGATKDDEKESKPAAPAGERTVTKRTPRRIPRRRTAQKEAEQ
jgi:hypothetical protein